MYNKNRDVNPIPWVVLGVICLVIAVGGLAFGCPHYDVWQQEMAGRAALAKATQDRQIAVQEAEAKEASAKALAGAEVARAKGVAEANRIIGDSLKDGEAYLRYLWITGLQTGGTQVIYVPTEASLPILEAGRGTGLSKP